MCKRQTFKDNQVYAGEEAPKRPLYHMAHQPMGQVPSVYPTPGHIAEGLTERDIVLHPGLPVQAEQRPPRGQLPHPEQPFWQLVSPDFWASSSLVCDPSPQRCPSSWQWCPSQSWHTEYATNQSRKVKAMEIRGKLAEFKMWPLEELAKKSYRDCLATTSSSVKWGYFPPGRIVVGT